jgi:ferritin-like metal-binding protein YciE
LRPDDPLCADDKPFKPVGSYGGPRRRAETAQGLELLGKPARGKKCDAIEGILDEGKEIMEEYEDEPALDAGLLAAAQAVEHYEISRYGTLKSWANKLGMQDAVKLLDQTLAEEKKTDDALTKLADSEVNAEAQAA